MRRTSWMALALLAIPGGASAQRVHLELRPQAGDTLRMRLDQSVEVSGTREGRSPIRIGSRFTMFSRAIVEGAGATGARILAVTDSITMDAGDEQSRLLADDARRQLVGRQMRLVLAPDGLVEVADDVRTMPREVSDLVAVMPASFPREPIAVGDTWMRQMPIPPSAQFGIPLGGLVRARFRLDSMSQGGALAYVSMRGTVESASGRPDSAGGNVSGSMIVNRRRGWLSESRFLVQLRASVVSPGAATTIPTNFRVKVTQHMRVSPGRVP